MKSIFGFYVEYLKHEIFTLNFVWGTDALVAVADFVDDVDDLGSHGWIDFVVVQPLYERLAWRGIY